MIRFYLTSAALYAAAALAEIAGCFAVWAWLRQGTSAWWLLPGIAALVLFAALLTRVDVSVAGRAYAAYGGIYILMSLIWLWLAEGIRPNGWDLAGAGFAVLGTLLILFGARFTR